MLPVSTLTLIIKKTIKIIARTFNNVFKIDLFTIIIPLLNISLLKKLYYIYKRDNIEFFKVKVKLNKNQNFNITFIINVCCFLHKFLSYLHPT